MRHRPTSKPILPTSRQDALRVDAKWAWHFRTLVALRDHLLEEQAASAGPAPSAPGRAGGDGFDREFVRALLAKEPDALGAINLAVERILRGTYGICEASGALIPPQRLRATPWIARIDDKE